MKRFAFLTLFLVALLSSGAAEDDTQTLSGTDKSDNVAKTTVTLNLTKESYTVTIPGELDSGTIQLSDEQREIGKIVVSNLRLSAGHTLKVSVRSASDFNFKYSDSETNLPYTLKVWYNRQNTDISSNDEAGKTPVLSISAGSGTDATCTLSVDLRSAPVYSGTYTDTLTFTVDVK